MGDSRIPRVGDLVTFRTHPRPPAQASIGLIIGYARGFMGLSRDTKTVTVLWSWPSAGQIYQVPVSSLRILSRT